jgi:hypothetical protein
MPTKPMFDDDPLADLEYKSRVQMGLTDEWRLESSAAAVHVGLEEQIERLEQDKDLYDEDRWASINVDDTPLAWLPEGYLLMTMKRVVDGEEERKAGFVNTRLEDGQSKNLESVARAICKACDENPDHAGDCRGNEFRWQDYLGAAKAALEAAGK